MINQRGALYCAGFALFCPVHMAFSFFRNHSADDILKPQVELNSKLKSTLTWSQNGRYVTNPIPATNTQKLSFNVNVKDLIDENGVFKIAVNCRILSQMLAGSDISYKKPHPFSLVLTIEEQFKAAEFAGMLYDKIVACNEVVNIAAIQLTAIAEADV